MELPIVQAPMAGVDTPELAAAVSNAGGLGSIGVGAVDAEGAKQKIVAVRTRTDRPFNVNVFCHQPAKRDPVREAAWLKRLEPEFIRYGATPPGQLTEIYQTFLSDDAKFEMLLTERPAVVSFHFGLPARDRIDALRAAGILLFATATNLAEGEAVAAAGVDAVVAQGYEAGGHRGMFDPAARDTQLGTLALTRILVINLKIPVIAAGGIMDGAGISAAMALGASAAQLGTAFVACRESAADPAYRAALQGTAAHRTVMTAAISGRPARCLENLFTKFGEHINSSVIPDYPIAYDAGKALHAAARIAGETGVGAQWAGQGAPLVRPLPAVELMACLKAEMSSVLQNEPHGGLENSGYSERNAR